MFSVCLYLSRRFSIPPLSISSLHFLYRVSCCITRWLSVVVLFSGSLRSEAQTKVPVASSGRSLETNIAKSSERSHEKNISVGLNQLAPQEEQ